MDDALAMRFVQRVHDLDSVLDRLIERQRPFGDPLGQRLAFQIPHHQEVDPVLAADGMGV